MHWRRKWQPTRLPCPWDSPGKNTGVGCYFLLQCMKVKSESEVASVVSDSVSPCTVAHQPPARLLCPWDSPGKRLEWVAMPSSRGSSRTRNKTHTSYISYLAGRFFTTIATWETLLSCSIGQFHIPCLCASFCNCAEISARRVSRGGELG